MGDDVLTQSQAWQAFDALLANSSNQMIEEPRGIDLLFRKHTERDEVSTKQWADGYLAAFAEAAGMKLVTFDQALAERSKTALLLG